MNIGLTDSTPKYARIAAPSDLEVLDDRGERMLPPEELEMRKRAMEEHGEETLAITEPSRGGGIVSLPVEEEIPQEAAPEPSLLEGLDINNVFN